MSESKPRITGTEMEWPVQVRTDNDKHFRSIEDSEVNAAIRSHDARLVRDPASGLLSNGGRYYLDIGSHPEYATPEETSIIGTVAREIAGESIVYNSLLRAKEEGRYRDFYMTKRVIDDAKTTCGYHINLSADAKRLPVSQTHLLPLGVHLATMNVFAGAGGVIEGNHESQFVVAQKSLTLDRDFSINSHNGTNPLISIRKESHARELYSRIHITSMDANMSPWATWMTLGTTSIMLRMMEHNYLPATKHFIDDAYVVAKKVASDTTLSTTLRRDDGETITPLDIQGLLMLRAKEFQKEGLMTTEEEIVLHEWEQVLYDLQIDPELAHDRVEWIARKQFIEAHMARNALSLSAPQIKTVDLLWSRIGPHSIGSRYRETVWKKWMPNSLIERAYEHPPTTTRALARAALVRQYAGSPDHHIMANWSGVRLVSEERAWYLVDPYKVDLNDSEIDGELADIMVGPIPE